MEWKNDTRTLDTFFFSGPYAMTHSALSLSLSGPSSTSLAILSLSLFLFRMCESVTARNRVAVIVVHWMIHEWTSVSGSNSEQWMSQWMNEGEREGSVVMILPFASFINLNNTRSNT